MSIFLRKEQTKISVNGFYINYLKVGHGPKTLLLTPGFAGQIADFSPLIALLDREKYTTIVWEPPGYGLSRPPDRDFSPGYLHRDAELAIALMEMLQIDKYSLLGWCDGGTVALIVASRAVDRVEKLVVWGCKAHVTEKDVEYYETIRDIEQLPETIRQINVGFYGKKYYAESWAAWIDSNRSMLVENGGDICRQSLSKIAAPTLIVHSAQDKLVSHKHANYLNENIENSELEIYADGSHALHIVSPVQFHVTVDKFLSIGLRTL